MNPETLAEYAEETRLLERRVEELEDEITSYKSMATILFICLVLTTVMAAVKQYQLDKCKPEQAQFQKMRANYKETTINISTQWRNGKLFTRN